MVLISLFCTTYGLLFTKSHRLIVFLHVALIWWCLGPELSSLTMFDDELKAVMPIALILITILCCWTGHLNSPILLVTILIGLIL